ncbi:hypothetical protein CCH79_00005485 [Gambusia affinis]|uniref:Galactosyltransferase N-terminal domain-containing protein n=1 Tax=Gambusia affinis TaxID=33528 RepID=A0A315V6M2_GAMAF|nr:hypothetical protein CCH79_00005485 [Gambusia affinis]
MATDFSLLHRTCKLVVLLCFLHISVTVFFYFRTLDIRFSFVQNQQSHSNLTRLRQGLVPASSSGTEPKETATRRRQDVERQPTEPGQNTTKEPVKPLEKCPETSPLLVGPLRVEFNIPVSLEQVKRDNPNILPGGRFRPKDCVALQKVAVIIPFRKRDEHLKFWLYYLHPILQRQQLDYGVYVINQVGPTEPH